MGEPAVRRSIIMLRVVATALPLALACMAAAQTSNFQSLIDAQDAVSDIMAAAGLRTDDFVIFQIPGEDNAYADIPRDGEPYAYRRIIAYDPQFLQQIELRTDEWGPMSVMAHEVAHHLLGHSVFRAGSNPPNELDADFYSGFILYRLGASLEQAQAVMSILADPGGSRSHPPRSERLDAIEFGWNKAGDSVVASADEGLEELHEELRRLEGQLSESEGRFREAEDRFREAEAERNEALDQLRQAQAEGRLTEERRSEMEQRIQEAERTLPTGGRGSRRGVDRTQPIEEFVPRMPWRERTGRSCWPFSWHHSCWLRY